MLFCGDDWAEDHHDVWLMDEAGQKLASARVAEGLAGLGEFHELMGGFVADPSEVVVGIETDRGLWVEALVASGYEVYAINPRSAARYRERHSLSGAKSDVGDAKVLADVVRTDRHNHRQVAGDTPEAEAIKVLARAHQTLIWERKRHGNRLRAALREYYPTALATFPTLTGGDALAVLAKAATPTVGAGLSVTQIRSALKKGGRQRGLDRRAAEIQEGLRQPSLRAPAAVEAALGATTRAAVAIVVELNRQIGELETELVAHFEKHPDASVYLSLPGFGVIIGARALGEFGDDPDRYATGKSRRNYAGTSPITIASGTRRIVTARWVKNSRLHDALIRWAFSALTASPGARAFYDYRRAQGDRHYKALRALANRLVGILHGCLQHHTLYDETTAWAHRQPTNTTLAA